MTLDEQIKLARHKLSLTVDAEHRSGGLIGGMQSSHEWRRELNRLLEARRRNRPSR